MEGGFTVEVEVSSGSDGTLWRRRWGGARVRHGKRGVLPEAAEDLPVPRPGHGGRRDDVRRDDVVRDAQAAEEDRSHGSEVSAASGVSLGSAPRYTATTK